MKTDRVLRRYIIAALALVWFGFCSFPVFAQGPIKIGMLLDQTGFFSWYGEKTLKAARLVTETINDEGGVGGRRVELVVHNTESNPERAIQGARQMLFEERVHAIVGLGYIGTAKAVAPLIQRNRGPVMYSTSGAYKSENRFVFAGQAYTGDVAIKTLKSLEKRGLHRVALLTTNNATGQNALSLTEKYVRTRETPIKLVAKELFNVDAVDLTAQLSSIRSRNPDVLFAWVIGKPMGVTLNNYRQLGMDIPVVSIHANIAPQFLRSLKEFQPEVLYMPATKDIVWEDLPEKDPSKAINRRFQTAFEKRYGEWSGLGGGTGHDIIRVLVQAIREKGTEPMAMVRYIESLDHYAGANGTYNFSRQDHRGLGIDDVVLTRVINGELHLIE